MTIRFQCSFCTQPIEVDDEWAAKAVACPYCRKTITAPVESTLDELSRIPTATPCAGVAPAEPQAAMPSEMWPAPVATSRNGVALVAFILACGMLVLAICFAGIMAAYGGEMAALVKPGATFSEQMRAMTEYAESKGGTLPTWLIAAVLLELGVGLSWIAALVCGIIGVRHLPRRGFAIASLVMAGLAPILLCSGLLVGPGP